MNEFQFTRLAAVIRFMTPTAGGGSRDIYYHTGRWAIIYTMVIFILPGVLLFPDMSRGWGLLFVFSVLITVILLLVLIGAAHGTFVTTDSSLTSRERKGIKELRSTRAAREKKQKV